jgi:plasmid maintenance system antidote protein VapI
VFFKEDVMDERNLQVTDVAKAINMSRPALSKFINGHAKCSQKWQEN